MGIKMTLKAEMRRERIKRYIATGLTPREMAELEKINVATISRDMKALKEQILKEVEKKDITGLLLHLKSTKETSLRELWKLYRETKHPHLKLGCLKQINQLLAEEVEISQRLGVLEKAPEKIEVSGSIVTELDELYERARKLHKAEEKNTSTDDNNSRS